MLSSHPGTGTASGPHRASYGPVGVVDPAATTYPPHARVSTEAATVRAVLASRTPDGAVKYRCCPPLAVRTR